MNKDIERGEELLLGFLTICCMVLVACGAAPVMGVCWCVGVAARKLKAPPVTGDPEGL